MRGAYRLFPFFLTADILSVFSNMHIFLNRGWPGINLWKMILLEVSDLCVEDTSSPLLKCFPQTNHLAKTEGYTADWYHPRQWLPVRAIHPCLLLYVSSSHLLPLLHTSSSGVFLPMNSYRTCFQSPCSFVFIFWVHYICRTRCDAVLAAHACQINRSYCRCLTN